MVEWSPGQDLALRRVDEWFGDPDQQVARVFGYAGTGKTLLARHFAEHVDGKVIFVAFTGKAALRMRQSGCPNASTIHSAIYTSHTKSRFQLLELERELTHLRHELQSEGRQDPDGHPEVQRLLAQVRDERENASQPSFSINRHGPAAGASLIVVDECSMVDDKIGMDLLSFGCKVLVLGDPAQLPPVRGAGFFIRAEPDVMLEEIHRQALDNPILQLATRARQEEALQPGDYGDSRVVSGRVPPEEVMAHDQILVGRNRTRHAANARARQLLGRRDPLPEPGDRLVCLRNDHEVGLLNGSLWETVTCEQRGEGLLGLQVKPYDQVSDVDDLSVEAHAELFAGGGADMPWWERKNAQEFDYGYALTVHKAQGSEWGSVMLYNESSVFRADRWRWLYTGLTRAADRITVALG